MLDLDEQQTLFLVSLLTNVLSFLSSLWLICSYSQSHQSTQSKMVINIVLSNCLISITGFLAFLLDREDGFYKINGLLSMIGLWSSAYWSVMTSILLYKKISKPTTFNSNLFYTYSLYIWGCVGLLLPIVLTTVVFNLLEINFTIFPSRFEKDTLSSDYVLLFCLIEWLPFGGSILMAFLSTIMQIRIIKEYYVSNFGDIQTSKLFKYPLALTLIFLPSLICKTWFTISPYNSLVLNSVRLFGYYLAGLIHFFAYRIQGYDPKTAKNGLMASKVLPAVGNTQETAAEQDYDEEDYEYRTV